MSSFRRLHYLVLFTALSLLTRTAAAQISAPNLLSITDLSISGSPCSASLSFSQPGGGTGFTYSVFYGTTNSAALQRISNPPPVLQGSSITVPVVPACGPSYFDITATSNFLTSAASNQRCTILGGVGNSCETGNGGTQIPGTTPGTNPAPTLNVQVTGMNTDGTWNVIVTATVIPGTFNFNLYRGASPGSETFFTPMPSTLTDKLSPGVYYFEATTVGPGSSESVASNEICVPLGAGHDCPVIKDATAPTLPEWAAIALAAILLGIAMRRRNPVG